MASSDRVYEDFKPPHRMEREPATHTLTVDLSAQGYKKEHVRVQMVYSHRRLIVRGERPVGVDGNRWSRFRLELRVPDGCDAKAIHARFDNGVVRVTMPGVQQPEPVVPVVAGTADQQQQQQQGEPPSPSPLPKHAGTAAAAGDDVQGRKGVVGAAEQDGGGGRDRAARGQEVDKQEARQRVVSSSKHAGGSSGRGDDTAGGVGQEVTAASPSSSRQGYGFLRNRKKVTITVVGVALVLISLGIYVTYSLSP